MHMVARSGRSKLLALWFFLTVAAVGSALILVSVVAPGLDLIPMGSTVLAFGALSFLVVQFWVAGTNPTVAFARGTPLAQPTGAPVNYNYATAPRPRAQADKTPRFHSKAVDFADDDLVEFELAGSEQASPTRLEVPAAFQVEVQADAEPVKSSPWIEMPVGGAATNDAGFVPAVERRKEIVNGLPLLTQIFSEPQPSAEPAPATRPGKTRGQCGSCGTFLWAPTQRPIRLRCPKCGHVKTLAE